MRKCRFPDEGSLKLFDYYTESSCKLECSWDKAEQVCGCKPWDVPASDGSKLCFILGNVCFSQVMKKIQGGEMEVSCDCSADCVYSRYTMSVLDRTILERTSIDILENKQFGTKLPLIGTDQIIANDFSKSNWYNMGKSEDQSRSVNKDNISGEYVKDVNFSLLGQERLLEHRFPRPVMEKGYCMYTGTWAALEEADRDPNTGEPENGVRWR